MTGETKRPTFLPDCPVLQPDFTVPPDPATESRLARVEQATYDIRVSVSRIADAMQKLALLEERHTETRETLSKLSDSHDRLDDRVHTIEKELGPLKEGRTWVVRALLTVAGAVGAALLALVIKGHQP